ncbi:xyloglucan galactosyltransferase KATAMARI1 homolog [Lolium rigidum]|uniref:xyloglucan galactosyltransferase KATAMARI1 homolog n=1 Tax=Lolium rigidum TaxID=89674 RepID=UPI001F5C15EB|nr:xyloglucan galactosyltransferase KATAMARI1 homolog [Lolium rigidum]
MSAAVTRPWFLVVVAAAFWACILYVRISVHTVAPSDVSRTGADSSDPCRGRYVYVHELPPRFNADMLSGCANLEGQWPDMCKQVSNAGLGEPLLHPDQLDGEVPGGGALTNSSGWYATQQFGLDAIFHARMRRYECLTNDSSAAAAVFVPFYAGFEFSLHQWGYDEATRDAASRDLASWLKSRPEWRRASGRDHFLVAGRTAWDFQRDTINISVWGTNLLLLDAVKNMTVLVIESSTSVMGGGSDMAVPYPTYFHPRADADVLDWQRRIRSADRPWLMSFVGAPRPREWQSIRPDIIDQCAASSACRHLGCASGEKQCHTPGEIMRLFRSSTFCLQPRGDSATRRSAFDAMVAGCVPVFFHPRSAYLQYKWHLPSDHTRYSVFITEDDVRAGNVSIEETLRRIPPATVREMQEEVVRIMPGLVYADPRYTLETVKDAFDLAVDGMLKKVAEARSAELLGGGVARHSTSQDNTISSK